MSIREDKKFMALFEKLGLSFYDYANNTIPLSQVHEKSNQLFDYIDEYVKFQIDSEEYSTISFEEGLQKLPDWQKELNQRMAKVLEKTND